MPDAAALVPTPGPDYSAALAQPQLPNLRRIGGEMFAWTDREPGRGPALPGGAVLRYLLTRSAGPGRTVLLAGPHGDDLVAALSGSGAAVTWLLRSLADAEEAARTHPAVTVLAGAAGKLDPAGRFDLVVAADGVGRLNSAEGEQMSVADLLGRLAGAVSPGGLLLLVHDNHLGVHHTVRLEPGARESEDAAWYPLDDHDPVRPASREQLTGRLADAGLVAEATYAVFPQPGTPTVLVGPGLVGDVTSPLRPWLGTALSRACTAAFRGRPVLSDPRRLIRRALRAGAEETVAPAWLVIARAPASGTAPAMAVHDLLVGDASGTFTYEVSASGGRVSTTVLVPLERPVEHGGLRRIGEPPASAAGAGEVLEERLLHLCATADLRRLRVELARYDTWVRGLAADGLLTGPVAVAGLADVLVGPDGPGLLPTGWEAVEPIAVETTVVRAFWEFAVQLITSAQPHPWPITSSARDLTTILLGMAGRGLTDAELRAAVGLRVALEAAEHGLTLDRRRDRELELLAVTPGTAAVDIAGFRELSEALWRQRYQVSHLLAQMAWTEQIIESRDKTLSRLDQQIQFYQGTLTGRIIRIAKKVYQVFFRRGR